MIDLNRMIPFVSVIIPTYKDWNRLELCLHAIYKQSYPEKHFEIIVINNDKGEDSPINSFNKNCTMIRESQPGSYAARNAGIKKSKGKILAFTDSDCIPDRKWIENGVNYLLSNPEVSFAGGKINLFYRNDKHTFAEVYEKAFGFRQEKMLHGRNHTVTANMFALRKAFGKSGLFKDDLFSSGDLEWCNRAVRSGLKIGYSEKANVFHPARHSIRQLLKKTIRVSGGQFSYISSFSKRIVTVIGGFFPPFIPLNTIKNRKDLTSNEKIIAFCVLYVLRITRSIVFLLLEADLTKPSRI